MQNLKIMLLILLAICTQPTYATLIQVDLDIEITTDETDFYLGEMGTGIITYDTDFLTSSGIEILTSGLGLVSLEIDILGLTLTQEDDDDYPNYPALTFIDGVFGGIDFVALPAALGGLELGLNNTTMIDNDEYFIDAEIVNPSAVPIPAAVGLFGSALLGLVGLKCKK